MSKKVRVLYLPLLFLFDFDFLRRKDRRSKYTPHVREIDYVNPIEINDGFSAHM